MQKSNSNNKYLININNSSQQSFIIYSIMKYLNSNNKNLSFNLLLNDIIQIKPNKDVLFDENNIKDDDIVISNSLRINKPNIILLNDLKNPIKIPENINFHKIQCENIIENYEIYPELIAAMKSIEEIEKEKIYKNLIFPFTNIALYSKDYIELLSSINNEELFKKLIKCVIQDHQLDCI